MLELFTLFILKILDNCLSTLKTTFLIKNKIFLSSLFNALATLSYMLLIVKLSKNNSMMGVLIISISAFLGSYIPLLLEEKLKKDRVFIFEIIPSDNNNAKELADHLRENNLAVQTYKGFNLQKEQVLCIKVFSGSREESILLESILPKDIIYHVTEIKKQVNINN